MKKVFKAGKLVKLDMSKVNEEKVQQISELQSKLIERKIELKLTRVFTDDLLVKILANVELMTRNIKLKNELMVLCWAGVTTVLMEDGTVGTPMVKFSLKGAEGYDVTDDDIKEFNKDNPKMDGDSFLKTDKCYVTDLQIMGERVKIPVGAVILSSKSRVVSQIIDHLNDPKRLDRNVLDRSKSLLNLMSSVDQSSYDLQFKRQFSSVRTKTIAKGGSIAHEFDDYQEFVQQFTDRDTNIMTIQTQVHFPLTSGVYCIYGGTGSGKSLFAKYLSDILKGSLIIFEEPGPSLYGLSEVTELLFAEGTDVVIVDSFRLKLFTIKGGTTGKAGVQTAIYDAITRLSSLCQLLNKKLIFTINPLNEGDDNVFDSVYGAIRSSDDGNFKFEEDKLIIESRWYKGREEIRVEKPDLSKYRQPEVGLSKWESSIKSSQDIEEEEM